MIVIVISTMLFLRLNKMLVLERNKMVKVHSRYETTDGYKRKDQASIMSEVVVDQDRALWDAVVSGNVEDVKKLLDYGANAEMCCVS